MPSAHLPCSSPVPMTKARHRLQRTRSTRVSLQAHATAPAMDSPVVSVSCISRISALRLTLASTGTQYIIGNTAIASVTPDGLITALTSRPHHPQRRQRGRSNQYRTQCGSTACQHCAAECRTGGAVQSTTGETVMVVPMCWPRCASLHRAHRPQHTEWAAPWRRALEAVAAFQSAAGG